MDKKLKKALELAFAAPNPEKKSAFLRVHRRREMEPIELMLTQAGYVRWWTWAGSITLFAVILTFASGVEPSAIWSASALTPLLALIVVAESGRARRYGMEELELSCRMARSTALLARLAAVGLLHIVLLAITAPVLSLWGNAGVLQAGAYLLTPYLITAAIGMELSRRVRGQEGLLACTSVAVIVCLAGEAAQRISPDLYLKEMLPLWCIILAIATTAAGVEFVKMIREMGELQWN